ncbi:NAD(P)/FAD-dependent oxidoreductase [Pseudomonas marincola]|uniref:NAD(P)/FAD-dependent oxidoreductase n=1 Tax=Pseudomonas marincola TaxID=437900 RepID=UPI0008E278E3|nr:NAD(P)/FAD-dependent oxidoreductase [Pseudomonas marincola]SFT92629.1 NADH dehydrogenase [Pseudomonas marincola]
MQQTILVVGTGFSGMWSALSAARLLDIHGKTNIDVVVLSPQPELRIRPRFYEPQVHTMMAPLDELFSAVGVKFIKGVAQQIDRDARQVNYVDEAGEVKSQAYDRLILATGSKVARPNLPGIEHAFDVDEIEHASALQAHIKSLAERPATPARNTVVIAGGGFTGIETAAELPAMLREALGNDTPVNVVVVDRGNEIGGAMGDGPRHLIAEASAELGVEWRLNNSVAAIDANGVTLTDGQRIEANTVVWTAGVKASSLTAQIPAEQDRNGRLHVERDLQVIGHNEIFATGDVAYAPVDEAGNYALMTCQHAISLGRHAGNNAAASLLGIAPVTYSQPKYVTCLDLGTWGAVYTEGWEREVKLVKDEAKSLKKTINSEWIYPPVANRAEALAAADPLIPVVA